MPQDSRVFPAGTGGNPAAPQIGSAANLGTTAQPPIRPPPDPFVQKSVEPFTDDDNIPGFVDGAGNRIWHVDTSASAKAITFVSAAESVDFDFCVKWTKGANGLKIVAAAGNVGGTTTFVGGAAGDAYEFRSDGIDYQLVSRVGDFITSAGLAVGITTGNLTVTGSATFSGTVAFLTSINVSGTASIGTLVVSGTASFSATVVFAGEVRALGTLSVSATLSVGLAITLGGAPLSSDWKKIGSTALSNVLAGTLSGSWTAYTAIRVEAFYLTSTTGADPILQISSDNGATYFLLGKAQFSFSGTFNPGGAASLHVITTTYSGVSVMHVNMIAGNLTGTTKYISGLQLSSNGTMRLDGSVTLQATPVLEAHIRWPSLATTATANSAIVNQISFSHRNNVGTTLTMSAGIMYVYGLA